MLVVGILTTKIMILCYLFGILLLGQEEKCTGNSTTLVLDFVDDCKTDLLKPQVHHAVERGWNVA